MNPQQNADHQEQQHHRHDADRAKHQRLPPIHHATTGKHPLRHELIDPVREQYKHNGADDAHPEIVRLGQREIEIQPSEFAGVLRLAKRTRPTSVDQRRQIKQGKQTTGQQQHELQGIRPDHRLNSTEPSVNQREPDK